jgi:hypothetical protein
VYDCPAVPLLPPRSDALREASPAMVSTLKKHQTTQKEERLRAGERWTTDYGLVFATEFGTPVEPRNILRTIETAAATTGIEGVVVHTLRHSAAVALLEAGVHIRAVADILGHSSISITGDIYGHSSDQATRAGDLRAVRHPRTMRVCWSDPNSDPNQRHFRGSRTRRDLILLWDKVLRVSAKTSESARYNWGSSGRRFKSCQPDQEVGFDLRR